MVKNKTGGNKAKRQGRKFVGTVNSKLRVAIEEGEIYAVVTKHFGNAMVDVMCIDGKSRICIIRNKFRGRGKRDNCLNVGTWILIGEREWEIVDNDKKPKCDLLEVYNQGDVEELKKLQNNWKILTSAVETEKQPDIQDDIVFADTETSEYIEQQDILINSEKKSGHENDKDDDDDDDDDDDEIDFDDI